MIKEAYCSFEVSKLLREKGFNTPCSGRYSVRSKEFHLDCTKMCNNGGLFECAAPTHQMAMAWLREKGVHMSINTVISSSGNVYYSIDVYTEKSGWEPVVDLYTSYEEAVEAALKICIENLI